MAKYTVLLEKITEEDQEQIVIHGVYSVKEAIEEAKRLTGQSVVEVEEDFINE